MVNSATTSVEEYVGLGLLTAAEADGWEPLRDVTPGAGVGLGVDRGPGWRDVLRDPGLHVGPEFVQLGPKSGFRAGGIQRARMADVPEVRAHLMGYPATDREEILRDLREGVGVRDVCPAYLTRVTVPERRGSLVGRRLRNARIVETHLAFALRETMKKVAHGAVRCVLCRGAPALVWRWVRPRWRWVG